MTGYLIALAVFTAGVIIGRAFGRAQGQDDARVRTDADARWNETGEALVTWQHDERSRTVTG